MHAEQRIPSTRSQSVRINHQPRGLGVKNRPYRYQSSTPRRSFHIAAQFNYHHIQYRLEQDVFGVALFVSEYVWRCVSNIRK
jgi:hypothetical protein